MSEHLDKTFWEQNWDRLYRDHADVLSKRGPNAQLIAEAAHLTPGTALDAGCGQGTDAIWLASRGWRVTAVDFIASALRQAQRRVETLDSDVAGRIDWKQADLSTWTPVEGSFDLVCSLYVHGMAPREAFFRRLAAAVAPGGTLLVVGHHPADRTSTSRDAATGVYFAAADVAGILEPTRWVITVAETRTRAENDFHGHEVTRYDAVLGANRPGGAAKG